MNWGNLLLDSAKSSATPGTASAFFSEAEKKYQAALSLKPDLASVMISWGNLLLDRGKSERGEEALRLFGAAEDKCTRQRSTVVPICPKSSRTGNVLLEQAKYTDGDESERLFDCGRSQVQGGAGHQSRNVRRAQQLGQRPARSRQEARAPRPPGFLRGG